MKRKTGFQIFCLTALLGLSVASTGCKSGARPYDVSIQMDASFDAPHVPVDIVGVNVNQQRQWEDKSVTDYWGDADPLRMSARKKTLEFSKAGEVQKLKKDDPIWAKWLEQGGVGELFVIADIPGMGKPNDAPGDADPRRRILPLNSQAWVKGTDELKVIITRGGLEVVTRQRPK